MTKAHVAFGKVSYKCEKLTDDGGQTTDAKWWQRQKLTLPLANAHFVPIH
jgi:hypothetical protein